MFKFLIDTCVWFDLAKDPKQGPVLGVVEEFVKRGILELLVPKVVLDEFRRNRNRIERESEKSLASHFKLVRDAAGKSVGDKKKLQQFISQLDDVAHKIPTSGGYAVEALNRIDRLLSSSSVIETSDSVKLKAAQRAIDKKAPFHCNKNSMADAVLMEIYADIIAHKNSIGVRFAFITHNKTDFSVEHGNQKLPHPDFNNCFSRIKSIYYLNLAEALSRIDPTEVSDIMIEQSWDFESRELSEIMTEEEILVNQIWYNRHKIREQKIENGAMKVVKEHSGFSNDLIKEDIWNGALRSAKKMEKLYGIENLGPWDDFEWGMLNGKLSALRWVQGYEWDMLHT